MGIFCGETCQCRRSCNEFLNWNDGAKSACRKSCGGANPPADGYSWWNALPPEIRMEYEGGAAAVFLREEAAMSREDVVGSSGSSKGTTWLIAGIGIMIFGFAAYLIFK